MKSTIKTVVVGTESALKIRAVKSVFEEFTQQVSILPCKASSGIGDQPLGTAVMEVGAKSRAYNAKEAHPGADLYIGIENGLVQQNDRWFDPTCVVAITGDGNEESVAFGAYFPIPKWMAERTFEQESELGEIVKELADGGEKDPMKYLSGGFVLREQLLSQAVQCALTPILFSHRYSE